MKRAAGPRHPSRAYTNQFLTMSTPSDEQQKQSKAPQLQPPSRSKGLSDAEEQALRADLFSFMQSLDNVVDAVSVSEQQRVPLHNNAIGFDDAVVKTVKGEAQLR